VLAPRQTVVTAASVAAAAAAAAVSVSIVVIISVTALCMCSVGILGVVKVQNNNNLYERISAHAASTC
jgi:hypothetical protein